MKFSKESMIEKLERKITQLEKQHGFDPANGWAQVESKCAEINRAYGEYSALQDLLEELA